MLFTRNYEEDDEIEEEEGKEEEEESGENENDGDDDDGEKEDEGKDKKKLKKNSNKVSAGQQRIASVYCPYCGSRFVFRYSKDNDQKKLNVVCTHCNSKIRGLMDLGLM